MENIFCCFIGHRKIENIEKIKTNLIRIINILIKRYNVNNFLFGDKSDFNNLCLEIVMTIKKDFPFIKLISYPSNDWYKGQEKENLEFNKRVLKKDLIDFDDYVYLDYYGKFSYVQRNEKMINNSDYCIFYYDKDYTPKNKTNKLTNLVGRKSGTQIAFEYANKKKKKIINIKNLT